jgi:hypothetical protein
MYFVFYFQKNLIQISKNEVIHQIYGFSEVQDGRQNVIGRDGDKIPVLRIGRSRCH